ncbi:unnamed protein product, partial [Clonostachys solani]
MPLKDRSRGCDIENSSLSSRGWVVQKRFLKIYWELQAEGSKPNAIKPTPRLRVDYQLLIDERIVADPPNGNPAGLLQSAELDIECMVYHCRWMGTQRELLSISHASSDFKLDISDLVRKVDEADKIQGVCIPEFSVHEGYVGGHNKLLVLEPHAKNLSLFLGDNDRVEDTGR